MQQPDVRLFHCCRAERVCVLGLAHACCGARCLNNKVRVPAAIPLWRIEWQDRSEVNSELLSRPEPVSRQPYWYVASVKLTQIAPRVNRKSPIHLNLSVLMSRLASVPYATDSMMNCRLAGGCRTLAMSMGLTTALQMAKAAVCASGRPQECARPLPLPPGTCAMGTWRALSQSGRLSKP